MPVFHIEMRWRCGACQSENLGRYKQCQSCGKAKEGEAFYDAPETANPTPEQGITDMTLIAQATAGPDWACKFCGAHQRRASGECANCGASEDTSAKQAKWDTPPMGVHVPPGLPSDFLRDRNAAPEPIQPLPWERPQSPRRDVFDRINDLLDNPKRLIAPVAGFLVLLGLALFFIFRTRVVDATLVSRAWEHKVVVERYQIVAGEGFTEDKPSNAFDVLPQGTRVHHYDKVPDGTRTERYTVSVRCGESCSTTPTRCTTNGNGFKTCSGGDRVCSPKYCDETRTREVTKYKDVPVHHTWYTWKSWQWAFHRNVVESGTEEELRWPTDDQIALDRNVGKGESERKREEATYTLVFKEEDGDKHTVVTKERRDFEKHPKGTKAKLRIGVGRDPKLEPVK